MNNFPLRKVVVAISMFVMCPLAVNAAEIFDPNEQLLHGKEMVESANLKEKKKLELEIAILDNEINNLDGSNKKIVAEAVKKATADMEKHYQKRIKALESQVASLEAKNKSISGSTGEAGSVADDSDIFFTGIIEVGDTRKAEVIVDGSRSLLTVGQKLSAGMTLSSIEQNRIVVRTARGTRSFPLKSSAQIADQLYQSAMSKVKEDRGGGRSNEAVRLPADFSIEDLQRRGND